ncbi:MAG: transketolase family protein [Acidobacteriia bacterium]|nr:transketolase family protein [Terriglobia bacterium]
MPLQTKFELKPGPATREAFGRALVELGRENKDIVVCDADLSKSTMTTYFAKEFPDRFFSCGIAEADMVGIGAGLAYAGKIPFVSSFSAFIMNKGFEQLRVSVAYPRTNVKVVGTHSGISIGEDGPSQMSVEETALACSLPGFVVMAPADEASTKALVKAAAAHRGPVFIRTGRPKAPVIYGADQKFEIGRAVELIDGSDVAIIANGLLVAEAIRAAESLDAEGVSARVVDMHTVKPLDRDAIRRAAATGAIVVAETEPCPMEFVGIQDTYAESGEAAELMEKYGLVAQNVAAAARRVIARKR